MSDNIGLTLTWPEIIVMANVGCMRQIQAMHDGWKHRAGPPIVQSWTMNIEGAGGELVVAKYLGQYYPPIVGNPSADDVGPLQVRTNCSRERDDLLLRPNDRDDRIFVSVLSFMPRYVICGWITGKEGKEIGRLYDGNGRDPCWYVARRNLRPMRELPKDMLPPPPAEKGNDAA